MIFAVAGKRTVAAHIPGADELEAAVGRGRDVILIEVDQRPRGLHAMRVVAGAACGFLIDDMESVPAILSQAIHRAETAITQDILAVMTFITERVVGGRFRAVIRGHQLPLEQGREARPVRPVCAGPPIGRTLIAIMAINTGHLAGNGPRLHETGNIRVFAGRLDWMI